MAYSTFCQTPNDASKERLVFWRPEDVAVSHDKIDFSGSPEHEHEQHIFISNLKAQILLDSIQGRTPNVAFLPLVSLAQLVTWSETWSFSKTINSRSNPHIIHNIVRLDCEQNRSHITEPESEWLGKAANESNPDLCDTSHKLKFAA
jgi:ribonucleoside-diphosphate reductase beta chain